MKIIGHHKIINQLNIAIKRGNLSHAYIFSGSEHLGKFTIARDLADKITNNSSPVNPDLIIVRPETEEKKGIIKKKNISVENIRDMQRSLMLAPSQNSHKVAIIDEADYLNKSAQNALLKTLEEPPERSIVILIAYDINKLLPTIVSRCQIKKFGPVSDKELGKLDLDRNKKDIIFWSLGRPGLAVLLVQNEEELKNRTESLDNLRHIFYQNAAEKFALAESWSKNIPELIKRLEWWLIILREAMLKKSDALPASREDLVNMAEKTAMSLEIVKNTNANSRIILENLLLEYVA